MYLSDNEVITGRHSDIITEIVHYYKGAHANGDFIAIPQLSRYILIPNSYILRLIKEHETITCELSAMIYEHIMSVYYTALDSYIESRSENYIMDGIEVIVKSDALRYCVYHINKDYLNLRR